MNTDQNTVQKNEQNPELIKLEDLISKLNQRQREAVETIDTSPTLIVTGGPGVGKTFTARAVVEKLISKGHRVALCAPTGKAAKRLTEATTHVATTIHRLLEPIKGRNGGFYFQRGANNPLTQTAIVVDEASMIDVSLMSSLCDAITDTTVLILIGDVDQLPSVGAGAVLRNLIDSQVVPVVRLDEVVRQKAGSFIVKNAHRINNGVSPIPVPDTPSGDAVFKDVMAFADEHEPGSKLENGRDYDFQLFFESSDEKVLAKAVRLAQKYDGQVIVPMHKTAVGTQSLNSAIQNAVNPLRPGMRILDYGRFGTQFRIGDKVMNTKNDAELGVFNGDAGVISDIKLADRSEGTPNTIIVDIPITFEDTETGVWKEETRSISFGGERISQLMHSYAITIHKSQGSEWEHVIIPLIKGHTIMLQRNLIYTAITRAKKMVWLIGTPDLILKAARNLKANSRKTLLGDILTTKNPTFNQPIFISEKRNREFE